MIVELHQKLTFSVLPFKIQCRITIFENTIHKTGWGRKSSTWALFCRADKFCFHLFLLF